MTWYSHHFEIVKHGPTPARRPACMSADRLDLNGLTAERTAARGVSP